MLSHDRKSRNSGELPSPILYIAFKSCSFKTCDKNFILKAIQRNYRVYFHISKRLRQDKEIFLTALRKNGTLANHNPKELSSSREVIVPILKSKFKTSNMRRNDSVQNPLFLKEEYIMTFAHMGRN